jgi:hypothetical protein
MIEVYYAGGPSHRAADVPSLVGTTSGRARCEKHSTSAALMSTSFAAWVFPSIVKRPAERPETSVASSTSHDPVEGPKNNVG